MLLSRCGHALIATGNGLRCLTLHCPFEDRVSRGLTTLDSGLGGFFFFRPTPAPARISANNFCSWNSRSLGKEKIEEYQWGCVVLGRRSSNPIEELHGYVPDSSLYLEHLMLKTQNRGERFGDWWISQANSYSRAHARMRVCVCVWKIENWASAARPLRIGYRKWYGPKRQWYRLLLCIVMVDLTEGSPSTCI